MQELEEQIADILAQYWLNENHYCGLPTRETHYRLSIQPGETPSLYTVRKIIKKLSQNGAVSTREVQNDVWVYPKRPVLEPRDHLTVEDVGIYTKQLRLGGSQIELLFFDRQALDRYRQDPRFRVVEAEPSGRLHLIDKFYDSPETPDNDHVGIQSLGTAYAPDGHPVVAVILWDLGRLSIKHQNHWASHEVREVCVIDADFVAQEFEAEDIDRVSPYVAFVQELVEINILCELMGKKPLFRNTYEGQLPQNFAPITKPSWAEYGQFIHLLDKMMSDNLSNDFFRGKFELKQRETIAPGEVRVSNKGTIALLGEYLEKSWKIHTPKAKEDILATFRQIRKERQEPAHAVTNDLYDPAVVDKQRELIMKAYDAVRTLRLLFMNHRSARAYQPDRKSVV